MNAFYCNILQLLLLIGAGEAVLLAAAATGPSDGEDNAPSAGEESRPNLPPTEESSVTTSPEGSPPLGEPGPTAGGVSSAANPVSPSDVTHVPSSDSSADASDTVCSSSSVEGAGVAGATGGAEAAGPPREVKEPKGRKFWKLFGSGKPSKQEKSPCKGVIAWEAGSENVHVTRITARRASTASAAESTPSPPQTTPKKKKKEKSRGFFRTKPRPSWSLLGPLNGPPPELPPTLEEFAAAFHSELPKVLSGARATHSGRQVPAQRRRSSLTPTKGFFQFLRRRSSAPAPEDPSLSIPSASSQVVGEEGRRSAFSTPPGSVRLSSHSGTGPLQRSASDTAASGTRPGTTSGAGEGYTRGSGTAESRRSRDSESCSTCTHVKEAPASSDESPSAPEESSCSPVWLPQTTYEEQQLIGLIIGTFIVERRPPREPDARVVPPEAAQVAATAMYDTERTKANFTEGDFAFTRHECSAGVHAQVSTTAYVLRTQESEEQSAYMQQVLVDLRGLLWAWSQLEGGGLLPWQAALQYNLLLPLDVSVVTGAGPLLPVVAGHVTVNGFVTRESVLCSFEEAVDLRPLNPEDEGKALHLLRLSFSVQVLDLLDRLSGAGIPVSGISEKTLSVTARGAVVVTALTPGEHEPGVDAQVAAQLLFRIWCTGSFSEHFSGASSRASLARMCSPRMPSVVAHAIEVLSGTGRHARMPLRGFRTSRYFQDLAAALSVMAWKLRPAT